MRRLPEFLSPAQREAFAGSEADALGKLRAELQDRRTRIWLSSDLTDLSGLPAAPVPLSSDVQLNFEVVIDSVPSGPLTRTVQHGKPSRFAAPQGLQGEVIAFFYEGDQMKARFRFYEASPRGRRLLMASSVDLEALVPMASGSSSGMLLMRAKPHTLQLDCTAERLN